MKYAFVVVLLLTQFVLGDEWRWQNPLPQGNYLSTAHFPSVDSGFIAGYGGSILKTTDGGKTWSTRFLGDDALFLEIHFWGTQDGIIVGSRFDATTKLRMPGVYYTHDGGSTWTPAPVPTEKTFANCKMLSSRSAVIGGPDGTILATSDGGESWKAIPFPEGVQIQDMDFSSLESGDMLATNKVYRTSNGGVTWSSNALPPGLIAETIGRGGAGAIFVGGKINTNASGTGQAGLFRSTDGGFIWKDAGLPLNTPGTIRSIRFVSDQIGYASGRGGFLLRTTDGGSKWNLVHPEDLSEPELAVSFASTEIGYSAGFGGRIRKTRDGGATWEVLSKGHGLFHTLRDVHFPTGKIGYGVGFDYSRQSPLLLKTMDAGAHWDSLGSAPLGEFNSVHFLDPLVGIMVGENGVMVKTVDGGASWAKAGNAGTERRKVVRLLDSQTALVLGDSGIERTSDAGRSWKRVWSAPGVVLNAIAVPKSGTAIAIGEFSDADKENGIILRTRNGGLDWERRDLDSGGLERLSFPSENVGYVIGRYGTIFKTKDGGDTWKPVKDGFSDKPIAIHFLDADTGYLAFPRAILRTSDGGANWESESVGAANNLEAMVFADRATAYAIGEYGTILKLTRSGASAIAMHESGHQRPRQAISFGKGAFFQISYGIDRSGIYDVRGKRMSYKTP